MTIALSRISAYRLRPEDIQPEPVRLAKVFTEDRHATIAAWLVRFFREEGSWTKFKESQVIAFCSKRDCKKFSLQDFIDDIHIVDNRGWLQVTHAFVSKCYMASPALRVQADAA